LFSEFNIVIQYRVVILIYDIGSTSCVLWIGIILTLSFKRRFVVCGCGVTLVFFIFFDWLEVKRRALGTLGRGYRGNGPY